MGEGGRGKKEKVERGSEGLGLGLGLGFEDEMGVSRRRPKHGHHGGRREK